MYIRKSTRSYRGKTYTSHLLVESVQTPKGPRQRTVCSLGDLSPRPRKEWLKLACKVEDALVGQGDLLDPDDGEVADIVRRVRARRARGHGDRGVNDETLPAPPQGSSGGLIKVDPTRVTTERHREAGPVHVGHQFWRRLGLDDILRDCKLSAPGLRHDAQSVDRALLRARHAGLDPAYSARRHSRRRLRGARGRPALSGARQAASAAQRYRGGAG